MIDRKHFGCRPTTCKSKKPFTIKVAADCIKHQTREGVPLLSSSRRSFLKSLSRSALVLPLKDVLGLVRPAPVLAQAGPSSTTNPAIGATFIDVGRAAGLNAKTIYGGEHKNKYLLETTGCGVAFYDYDNDGWLDIFLVNGWRLEGFPKGE